MHIMAYAFCHDTAEEHNKNYDGKPSHFWLLVAGVWLQVVGVWLQVVGIWYGL